MFRNAKNLQKMSKSSPQFFRILTRSFFRVTDGADEGLRGVEDGNQFARGSRAGQSHCSSPESRLKERTSQRDRAGERSHSFNFLK